MSGYEKLGTSFWIAVLGDASGSNGRSSSQTLFKMGKYFFQRSEIAFMQVFMAAPGIWATTRSTGHIHDDDENWPETNDGTRPIMIPVATNAPVKSIHGIETRFLLRKNHVAETPKKKLVCINMFCRGPETLERDTHEQIKIPLIASKNPVPMNSR
jgi:hypothetical protein